MTKKPEPLLDLKLYASEVTFLYAMLYLAKPDVMAILQPVVARLLDKLLTALREHDPDFDSKVEVLENMLRGGE